MISNYFPENDYRTYLIHHGVSGQKWGVRKAPWYPIADWESHLKKSSKRDKSERKYSSVNLVKWGKTRDTNILYLTGSSGSGKSTLADELAANGKVQVIHLDPYLGMMSPESRNLYQNKDFNKYLSKKVPEYRDVLNPDGKLNYKIVDKIAKASEDYGKEKFGKEKVIIEGVQLFDETFYANRDSYRNKPIVALKTNPILADFRGSKRDSENIADTIELFAYRLPMSIKTYKAVDNFEKDLQMKIGTDLYKELMSKSVFISGSSKTQDKNSGFYRKKLPPEVKKEIDKMIKSGDRINVGDAPGIDRQVQDYLKKKNYDNVQVYGPGKEVRYTANKKWKTNPIDAPEFEPMSPGWLAKKDIQMEKDSDSGLAITIKGGASATRNNIDRLTKNGKSVLVYELDDANESLDRWLNNDEIMNIKLK